MTKFFGLVQKLLYSSFALAAMIFVTSSVNVACKATCYQAVLPAELDELRKYR